MSFPIGMNGGIHPGKSFCNYTPLIRLSDTIKCHKKARRKEGINDSGRGISQLKSENRDLLLFHNNPELNISKEYLEITIVELEEMKYGIPGILNLESAPLKYSQKPFDFSLFLSILGVLFHH
jgi:hypothetical protein